MTPVPHVFLSSDGHPIRWRPNIYNIAFRFGARQPDKRLACDDLKHSMVNLAGSVHTPIRLVAWDHMARLPQLMAKDGGVFALTMEDREEA